MRISEYLCESCKAGRGQFAQHYPFISSQRNTIVRESVTRILCHVLEKLTLSEPQNRVLLDALPRPLHQVRGDLAKQFVYYLAVNKIPQTTRILEKIFDKKCIPEKHFGVEFGPCPLAPSDSHFAGCVKNRIPLGRRSGRSPSCAKRRINHVKT